MSYFIRAIIQIEKVIEMEISKVNIQYEIMKIIYNSSYKVLEIMEKEWENYVKSDKWEIVKIVESSLLNNTTYSFNLEDKSIDLIIQLNALENHDFKLGYSLHYRIEEDLENNRHYLRLYKVFKDNQLIDASELGSTVSFENIHGEIKYIEQQYKNFIDVKLNAIMYTVVKQLLEITINKVGSE